MDTDVGSSTGITHIKNWSRKLLPVAIVLLTGLIVASIMSQVSQANQIDTAVMKNEKLSTKLASEQQARKSLEQEKTKLTSAKTDAENKLQDATRQLKASNDKIATYEKAMNDLTQQAKAVADGEPKTFAVVTNGTPIEPFQWFTGVGKVVDANGNEVE